MSNITLMCRAVDFIEQNLQKEITIADTAQEVCCSLYHFSRTFNRIIHHTPYHYLLRRRLTESARELINTDKKIIDLAYDYQFNSPEAYSRAFKRVLGCSPRQLRKQGHLARRRCMPRLTLDHIQHLHQGTFLKPLLVEKEAIHIAGIMALIKKDAKTKIRELWEILAQELEGLDSKKCYGLVWYPQEWETRGFFYMAAVETQMAQPCSLVTKTIPAHHYARFVHHGPLARRNLTLDYIYHTWLPKSGQSIAFSMEIEDYGIGLHGLDTEAEVFIPIKKHTP